MQNNIIIFISELNLENQDLELKEILNTGNIKKFENLKINGNTIYIVSTPIGNLEDISFRALFILENVDFILAEDTRVIIKLLNHYGIKNKIKSNFSLNEKKNLTGILKELGEGKSVALVSDAGTPLISDPGNILVKKCIENETNVVSIPGANALIQSVVLSGFESEKFYFQGFLPKKGREKILQDFKKLKMLIVIYESKYKIIDLMNNIKRIFPYKKISISRELTKKFEQTIRFSSEKFSENMMKLKGEFVLIINNF